jgi:hypothetical protein
MRRVLKLTMIILMIVGITLSVLNFISVDNIAVKDPIPGNGIGTQGPNGPLDCTGPPLNC